MLTPEQRIKVITMYNNGFSLCKIQRLMKFKSRHRIRALLIEMDMYIKGVCTRDKHLRVEKEDKIFFDVKSRENWLI